MAVAWVCICLNLAALHILLISIGCLSVTNSNPLGKLDIPVKEWPIAPFPKMKYPMEVVINHSVTCSVKRSRHALLSVGT